MADSVGVLGEQGAGVMARSVDSGGGWTAGSPQVGGCLARGAFALSLFGLAGLVGVAPEFLHIPALLGQPLDARAALCRVAWISIGVCVCLGALVGRLQRADVHTGGEVT